MNLYNKILFLLYLFLLSTCKIHNPLELNPTSHLQICQQTVLSELPYIKNLFIYYYPSYLSPDEKLLLATYWDQFLVLLHLDEMQNKIGSISYSRKFLKDPWKGNVDPCPKNPSKKIICEKESFLPTSSAYILELVRYPQKYLKTKVDPFFSAETFLHWVRHLLITPDGHKNISLIEEDSIKYTDKYPTYPVMLQEISPSLFISAFAWTFFLQLIFMNENDSTKLVKQILFLYEKYQNFPFLSNIRGGAVDNLHLHTKSYPTHIFIDPESKSTEPPTHSL